MPSEACTELRYLTLCVGLLTCARHVYLLFIFLALSDLQELVDAKIQRTTDFEWVSRLRYYWRDDVYVDMVQVRTC